MHPTQSTAAKVRGGSSAGWTLALVSAALFMVTLDNLVVTTALPSIRSDLGASIEGLEWTVNAYTLSFAVLLLTGAALGDRFGRKRMFVLGVSGFTLASAAAAIAPSMGALIAARGIQGAAAAMVAPLTLTLLSEAFPQEKRGVALGVWSGISGLGVALGPLVGGAVVEGLTWQWIFWVNVPVGLVLVPLAARRLSESRGPARGLDLPGVALASAGLLGIVYGIVRGNALGWGSASILVPIASGLALLAAFVAYESRAKEPVLPMRFFRTRGFAATSGVSIAMTFGIFGSIFLLAQFFQTVQGYSPLEAGLRTLPWTGMPMLVAPIAGLLSDRIGSRPLMSAGLAFQAIAITWLAATMRVDQPYAELLIPFVLGGTGMALVFAPAANAVLRAVRPHEAGQASGANNALRELGGVMGVAVLAAVFTANGGYESPQAFVDGVVPALHVGAGVLVAGALIALLIPGIAHERRAVAAEGEALAAAA
ncbi:MAG TPA: MFS transporter [Solirubrobacteraceae bacterium]|jgi:EmrB/QacA subfamily drug resistance transporter